MKVIDIQNSTDRVFQLNEAGAYQFNLNKSGSKVTIFVRVDHSQQESSDRYLIQIHHQAPHTEAHTIMKSVVGKGRRVKLVGRIVVNEGAYGCSSFLTQRILLLDASAVGEAVPELEIMNNDVQCSHAASISSIPEEQLHYLMARGLSKAKATEMIAEGFLGG